jgi:hypothetical protein
MKERTLDMAVDLVASARNESTNGRIKRDTMAGILLGLPSDYTRNMIYSREKKRRRVAEESLDSTNDIEITIDVPELAPAPCNTVLLLDGHNSRFNLGFLEYINDPSTKWFVVLGLPYGTHVWQVGDSSEQNGSFNNAFYGACDILYDRKRKTGQPPTIVKTDIMPLVNEAWGKSFARRESNKKAISARGWNPLNRGCLKDPEVLATKPAPKVLTEGGGTSGPSTGLDGAKGGEGAELMIRLNATGLAGAGALADLVDYSRTRATQQARQENKDRGRKVADLTTYTKNITSGTIYSMGHALLGPPLLAQVQNKVGQKKAEAQKKQDKKTKRPTKRGTGRSR